MDTPLSADVLDDTHKQELGSVIKQMQSSGKYSHDQISGTVQNYIKANQTPATPAPPPPAPPMSLGKKIANVGLGAIKGAVGTAQSGLNLFGPLVNRIADPISHALGAKVTPPLQQSTPESWKTTTNGPQRLGYGAEQVGEALIPIGGAGKEAVGVSGRVGSNLGKIIDYTKPLLSKAEEQAAKEAGTTATRGLLRKVVTNPTEYDKAVGQVARNVGVNASHPFDRNILKINTSIEREATNLSEGLKKTGAIWNRNQVVGKLRQIEPEKAFKSDATVTNAYKIVRNKMIDVVEHQKTGTLDSLLNARKEFDRFVQKELPNIYSREQMTPFKKAILDTRSALNQMIDERLPEGRLPNGTSFRDSLKKQSLLFDARENIAAKAPKAGANRFTDFAKKHPYLTAGGEIVGGIAVEKELKKYLPFLP